MNGDLAVFAFSGVIFLGVGDTIAALYGRMAGVSGWRPNCHSKTQEGSFGLVCTVSIVYYLFCYKVFAPMCSMFLLVILGTIAAAVLEGWTS